MCEDDFVAFTRLLDSAFSLNPSWKPLPPTGKALFFKALEPYSIDAVSRAMTAHIRDPQRGRFQPVPADLVAQIEAAQGDGGRPGADEAWSIAMLAQSEQETVVWTGEMQEAFAVCRPVLDAGDKVGARMAFKDAYVRIVSEASRQGRVVKWEVTLGHDKDRHALVIERAVQQGRLTTGTASVLLPPPAIVDDVSVTGMAMVRQALEKLVPADEKMRQAREAAARAEREATAERKRVLDQQVRAVAASGTV